MVNKAIETKSLDIKKKSLIFLEDIPNLEKIKYGYEVDTSLESIAYTIKDYIDGFNLNMKPDYQRDLVWSNEQKSKYVEFIIKGGKTANVIYFNCPSWNGEGEGDMECIDGMQRLTAVLEFLSDNLVVFDKFKYSDFAPRQLMGVGLKFNILGFTKRVDILNWYLSHNDGGVPHTKEDLNKVVKLIEKENV